MNSNESRADLRSVTLTPSTVLLCVGLGAAILVTGCATTEAPVTIPQPVREDFFLLSPETGYPLIVDDELERRTAAIFDRLRLSEDLEEIAAATEALIGEVPDHHPAIVLLAQVETLRQEFRSAADRLTPISDELPDYVACQVLRGHVAEELGDVESAFEAYSAVAAVHETSASRAIDIGPRAAEIVFNRLEEAVARGHLEEAETHRAWLEKWIADEVLGLEASALILAAAGDREGELDVVCRLSELNPGRDVRSRCGELQVEVGQPRAGLEIFEALVAEYPEDAELTESLDKAKFRWRLELLPAAVGDVGRRPSLERADLATLLYWLVPQVRSSQINNPPIATDILESSRRDEILRVLDLDLMKIDVDLHRFYPEGDLKRLDTLAALLRLLDAPGARFACLDGTPARSLTADAGWVCRRSIGCGLITESAECLPRANISGSEALELLRRSLELLAAGTRADAGAGDGT